MLGFEKYRPRKLGALHLLANDVLQRQDVEALFILVSRHGFITCLSKPDQVRWAAAGSVVGGSDAGEKSPDQ